MSEPEFLSSAASEMVFPDPIVPSVLGENVVTYDVVEKESNNNSSEAPKAKKTTTPSESIPSTEDKTRIQKKTRSNTSPMVRMTPLKRVKMTPSPK
eukprot:Ihof_evm4s18 gene=Ihof_evmTU4s18